MGSTVIGEKGQIVIPADVRKEMGINPGDKFLVFTGEGKGGVMLVKAEVASQMLEHMLSMQDVVLDDLKNEDKKLKDSKKKSKKKSKKTKGKKKAKKSKKRKKKGA